MMLLHTAVLCAFLGLAAAKPGTPLYDYVNFDDGYYTYDVVDIITNDPQCPPGVSDVTTYIVNMTSQKWLDESHSDKPIWYHWVAVHVPNNPDPRFLNNGFVYIGSGAWTDGQPNLGSSQFRDTCNFAARTGMVAGAIRQTPFQPIVLARDPTNSSRKEDQIIAPLWKYFLEDTRDLLDPNPEILVRFPMCKAVSKAMDTMTTVAANHNNAFNLQKFMAAGLSKRGWATWLMPAADARIDAIAPTVLSILNMAVNMHHYWQSLGGWTFAFMDYYMNDIPRWMDDAHMYPLLKHVDPYQYRDELANVAKLMVSGASDEFFFCDDYDYFYDAMGGEKHIWLMENAGHDVYDGPNGDLFFPVMESYYMAVIMGHTIPQFTWTKGFNEITGDGYIEVIARDYTPAAVEVWYAYTPDFVKPRRDFRQYSLAGDTGVYWNQTTAVDMGGNMYRANMACPPNVDSYLAFYIKMIYDYPEEAGRQFIFTSEAQVLSYDPKRYFPYDKCTCTGDGSTDNCMGSLV